MVEGGDQGNSIGRICFAPVLVNSMVRYAEGPVISKLDPALCYLLKQGVSSALMRVFCTRYSICGTNTPGCGNYCSCIKNYKI